MTKNGRVAKCDPVIANRSSERCGNPLSRTGEYGFPRQCDHWLGMTGGCVHFATRPFSRLSKNRCAGFFSTIWFRASARFRRFSAEKSAGYGVFDHNHIDDGQKRPCRGRCPQRPVSFGKHKSNFFDKMKNGRVAKCSPVIANRSAERCGNPFSYGGESGFPSQCDHWLGMTGVCAFCNAPILFCKNYCFRPSSSAPQVWMPWPSSSALNLASSDTRKTI